MQLMLCWLKTKRNINGNESSKSGIYFYFCFRFVGNPLRALDIFSLDSMIQNKLFLSSVYWYCVFYLHHYFLLFSFFSMNGTRVVGLGVMGVVIALSCLFYPGKTLIFFACEKTFGEIYYLLRMNTTFSIQKFTEPDFFVRFSFLFFFCCCCCSAVAVLLNIYFLVWSLSPKFHLFGSFLCQILDNHSE